MLLAIVAFLGVLLVIAALAAFNAVIWTWLVMLAFGMIHHLNDSVTPYGFWDLFWIVFVISFIVGGIFKSSNN